MSSLPAGSVKAITHPPESEWQEAANTVFQAHGRTMEELFNQYIGEANWAQALDILEGAMERVPDNKVESCAHIRQHLESLKR